MLSVVGKEMKCCYKIIDKICIEQNILQSKVNQRILYLYSACTLYALVLYILNVMKQLIGTVILIHSFLRKGLLIFK